MFSLSVVKLQKKSQSYIEIKRRSRIWGQVWRVLAGNGRRGGVPLAGRVRVKPKVMDAPEAEEFMTSFHVNSEDVQLRRVRK